MIRHLQPDSAAERIGLEFGDVILTFAGEKPRNFMELTEIISGYEPGAEVVLEIYRNGEREKLKVNLGEWE